MSNWGKDVIQIFEVDELRCTRTYGSAPCAAVLGTTGQHKCTNARGTCQDLDNYSDNDGANFVTIRYARPQDGLMRYYDNILPALESLSVTPTRINLACMDGKGASSAFGARGAVSAKLRDFSYSDALTDPYRLERHSGAAQADAIGYDPEQRGTHFGKWVARNTHYVKYNARVRSGYLGDALEDMRVQHYVLDAVVGPNNGLVSMSAKDIFSRLEPSKAVAPKVSLGRLSAGISAVAGSLTLTPAGIGNSNYPASGKGRIGNEVVAFTRAGDVVTLTARAQLNTVAAAHDADDIFQIVLEIIEEAPPDIAHMLFSDYTEVPASAMDLAAWQAEAELAGINQLFTTYITEPTPVAELLGELQMQALFTLWPDISTGEVRFTALRAQAPAFVVSDEDWARNIQHKQRTDKRLTEVWVYHSRKDPTKPLDDQNNYGAVYVDPNFEAEEANGEPKVFPVFSRWIPQGGRQSAARISDALKEMFAKPPYDATIELDIERESELELARFYTLSTAEIQDATGARNPITQAIVSIERNETSLTLEGQQVVLGETNGERVVFVDEDMHNVNIRTFHDSLYSPAVSGSVVRCYVSAERFAGSTSVGAYALDTGTWPAGVDLIIEIYGEVAGKGGDGGSGGNAAYEVVIVEGEPVLVTTAHPGAPGEAGGPALRVQYACTVTGSGVIRGGYGGGGGGGGAVSAVGPSVVGGSSGGGARGFNPGVAGTAGQAYGPPGSDGGEPTVQNGAAGTPGSKTANGTGGASVDAPNPARAVGGAGGNAGTGAGGAGVAGGAGSADTPLATGAGGAAGARGVAIQGFSLVTFTDWTGTVDGPTAG